MRKLSSALTLAFCILLSFQSKAQENKITETVMIKVIETLSGSFGKSKMVVLKPDNQIETTALETIKGLSFENVGANGLFVQKEIKKWTDMGFKIKGLSNGGSENKWLTTIILVKE